MLIGNKPTPFGSPGRGGSPQEVAREVQRAVEQLNAQGQVQVRQTEKGVQITIADEFGRPPFAFDSGSSRLKPRMIIVLNTLADLVRDGTSQIRIEGHTDSVPINTPEFPSNWVLSTRRATEVLDYFISQGVDPKRFSASGYSQYKPIADNNTPEGRAKNRRVEIYIQYGEYGPGKEVTEQQQGETP
jgi:chemotaxis protein MotB